MDLLFSSFDVVLDFRNIAQISDLNFLYCKWIECVSNCRDNIVRAFQQSLTTEFFLKTLVQEHKLQKPQRQTLLLRPLQLPKPRRQGLPLPPLPLKKPRRQSPLLCLLPLLKPRPQNLMLRPLPLLKPQL